MADLEKELSGGDLRSKGKAEEVAASIKNQEEFDSLFRYLDHDNQIVAMRTADAVEKVTRVFPEFLNKHKDNLLELCYNATDKEKLWHLAAIVPRLLLREPELAQAWDMLSFWARNRQNSRIVRVMSIQALYELLKQNPALKLDYHQLLEDLENEQIPSVKARIRLIRKQMHKAGLL